MSFSSRTICAFVAGIGLTLWFVGLVLTSDSHIDDENEVSPFTSCTINWQTAEDAARNSEGFRVSRWIPLESVGKPVLEIERIKDGAIFVAYTSDDVVPAAGDEVRLGAIECYSKGTRIHGDLLFIAASF